MESISEQVKLIPENSGSYQFYDKNDEIIYVGKAKNLKKRVSSYFIKNHPNVKVRVMVPQIKKIRYIITNTEVEALILESHLIKKYKPKYNILLKDDKKFPYFLITKEEYPRILVVRKRNKNPLEGKYFGPYTNGKAMYSTLELLKKIFPLKQCKTPKFKDRPCLYYDIGRCQAPCQHKVTSEEYKKTIKNVEMFISGKQEELVEELKKRMEEYSKKEEYDKALRYRDSYFDVLKTMERQKVIFENTKINQDVITIIQSKIFSALTLLQIRDGRLTDKKNFELRSTELDSKEDVVSTFIKEYYQMTTEIPKEIIFDFDLETEDKHLIEQWLTSLKGSKVLINATQNTKNKEILEIGKKNCEFYFEELKIKYQMELQNDFNEIGAYIKEKLKLKNFPHRAECFDISHIQGTNTVASMVVFENGMPKKSEYKRFKIRSTESKPDDFKSMEEVVRRRYSRLIRENKPLPDLIIIDGGKGQLSSAVSILKELETEEPDIISLAKRIEEVFVTWKKTSVIFPSSSNALFFFQKIRDEAHRFAITYHRKLREKGALTSELDNIKGLFTKNKQLLLQKYKDIKKISKLTTEELMPLMTKSQAQKVFDYFNK
ncbi:excinuclease ABC subunit UvrC [bacterium]|nr:excinuclease ABC subunit UvrC [bacterium]